MSVRYSLEALRQSVTSGAYAGLPASGALVLLSRDQQLKARDQDLKSRELDLKKGNSYNQRMLFQQNQQLTAQLINMNDFLMQQQNNTLRFDFGRGRLHRIEYCRIKFLKYSISQTVKKLVK